MLSFSQVQSKIAELIAGHASFSAIDVVTHVGSQANEETIEGALDSTGVAVIVAPPGVQRGSPDTKAGRAVAMLGCPVFIRVNPEKAAEVNITALAEDVVAAVIAYTSQNPTDRFSVGESGLNLDLLDPGLISYEIEFTKPCAF